MDVVPALTISMESVEASPMMKMKEKQGDDENPLLELFGVFKNVEQVFFTKGFIMTPNSYTKP